MTTLAYGLTSSCVVFACKSGALDDNEWKTYVDFLKARGIAIQPVRALVYAEGAGPTSTQRALLNDILRPYVNSSRIAVLTSSRVSIGIVTAMSWFTPGFRAFLPQNIEAALDYLDLPSTGRTAALTLLNELQRQLDVQVTRNAASATR